MQEIFYDLNSGKVMDRLLSGDVGFGKTEVAMNALLAVVLDDKQAFFVCPTTLLAAQHYNSMRKRFEVYNITIAKLDSKTSLREKDNIKKELETGELQILIGTHSLLSIKAKDLALVIVDEEHKFGVKQKEKLSKYFISKMCIFFL